MSVYPENTMSLTSQLLNEEEKFNAALQQDVEFEKLKKIWIKIKEIRSKIDSIDQQPEKQLQ